MFESRQPRSVATLREKMCDLLNNFFAIYFEPISKIHYSGGRLCHPPALWFRGGGRAPASKIAICAGTRLLAGVAPTSTNAFWPPVKIVSGLVSGLPNQDHARNT
jgi:hypothetical protein